MLGIVPSNRDAGPNDPKFLEVLKVRPIGVWTTVKQVQLQTQLLQVPRAQRAALKAYIAGKRND